MTANGFETRQLVEQPGRARLTLTSHYGDVLLPIDSIGDRADGNDSADDGFSQHLSGIGVECFQSSVEIAPKHQIACLSEPLDTQWRRCR